MESMAEIASHRARREQEAIKEEGSHRSAKYLIGCCPVAVYTLPPLCHPAAAPDRLRQIACAKSPAPEAATLLPPCCQSLCSITSFSLVAFVNF